MELERLGEMESFLQKLKRLDAYPKVNEDFYKRTLSGGVVTLVAAVVMLLLFISETSKCPFRGRRCSEFVSWLHGPAWLWNSDYSFSKKKNRITTFFLLQKEKLNSEACFVWADRMSSDFG